MAATDKFLKGARRFSTTLASSIGASDTTIALTSTTGLPTDTAIEITIDRVDSSGNKTPSKEEVVRGDVSGTNLINCVRGVEGTAQAHSAGAVVEVRLTADQWGRMIDGILAEHSQSGAHNTTYVVTPTATQTLTNKTLTSPTINQGTIDGATYKKTIQTVTTLTGTTPAIDCSLGNVFRITLSGNTTFSVSNASTGQYFIVEVKQGSGTSYTCTWFSGITWITSGGTAPTQTTVSNGITTYGFRCTGTNTYEGYLVGTN